MRQIQEMLLLDVDNAATKKFSTVQTHLRVGQLREAIELLQSIGDAHAGKLVAAGKGRYVNVQYYAQTLAAGLSPEGLKIYRQELDPVLKPAFDAARNAGDEGQLRKVLQQGYCCSFSDDALLMLGDLAWDAGDVWRARSYWEQLLPPPPPKQPSDPVAWLAYPDSDLEQPLIVGRLILCSIQSGQRSDIQKELAEFARRYPKAEGSLAGKSGNLLEILQNVAKEADSWREPVQTNIVETFAGSPQRYHLEPQAVELGNLRWRASLKPFGEEPRRGFQQAFLGGPCYFPVVYGDVVLVNDDDQILAYRLQTGKPAWSAEPNDARIYWSGDHNEAVVPQGGFGEALLANVGWPRFTMTIADGRLYARMGSVRPYSGDRGGFLVCLDLAHGEGKQIWETFASAVEPDSGGWIFEGSPVVEGGRVYVGLRRTNPQPQANVACFDALTGKLIWNRKLCVGQTNPNFTDFDVNQHLLTWGEGTLYYTTHMGAIAALDPQQGTIKWIVSYHRAEDTKVRHEMVSRLQRGPLPAMFANGMLYAAPIDSDELLAIDAETGLLKWKRSFSSPIHALLGVSKGQVFASGPDLWAISVDTGQITWKVGDPDPESHGFGRGLLVEDMIYWPTREEIFLIEQETGALRQRSQLFAIHGQYGGNLIMTDGHLLIAQPHGLAVFSERGPRPDRSKTLKPELTRRPSSARQPWDQARHKFENQAWEPAADEFRRARESAQVDDEWMGRPLAAVATEYEIDCRLRHAWSLTKSDPTAANNALARALDVVGMQRLDSLRDSQRTAIKGWHLRFPSSTPEDMRTWIGQQVCQLANSPRMVKSGNAAPAVEQVLESGGLQSRLVSWQDLATVDEADASEKLLVAERQVATQPRQAADALRRLTRHLSTPDERARAWCGVARALEASQAWGSAAAAWKHAAHLAPREFLITDAGRGVPLTDLIRDRLEQPQYVRQQVLTSNDHSPAVLFRHWQQSLSPHCRAVYPVGVPPAVDLACVLLDRSPVTCLNLADGAVRWRISLSHPLRWAGYVADCLLLATEAEVRAVAVHNGDLIWHRRFASESVADRHQLADTLHIETVEPAESRSYSGRRQSATDFEQMPEFTLAGETLLARLGDRHILAWDALNGNLSWQFEARRGLAPGWAVTEKLIVLSERSPASLVVLDRQDGTEVARYPSVSAPWIRPPVIREDGTLLTVGLQGKVESWSKPGPAWHTEEGPRAWVWNDSYSQSIVPPNVMATGPISLLVMDGTTLVAVDSILGNTHWKTVLGTSPIEDARSAICFDSHRVYVAADGMLRAFDLQSGGLTWERYLGSPSLTWNSCVQGRTVIAYPTRSAPPAVEGRITICDTESGRYAQRLALPANSSSVQVYPTAHTTLVACGNTLCGLRRP